MEIKSQLVDEVAHLKQMVQNREIKVEHMKDLVLEMHDLADQDRDEIKRLKALITELCDALDRSDPIQISIQEVAALLDRAKEAAK